METLRLMLDVLIVLIGTVTFFAVKNFLPSYINEKEKNLATKEDISEITETVETIKTSFSKELEFVKADIQFLNQNRFSIISSERTSIIKFNSLLSEWLNTLMSFSNLGYSETNYKELNQFHFQYETLYINCKIADDELHLFGTSVELINAIRTCLVETAKLHGIVTMGLVHLIDCYGKIDLNNKFFQDRTINYQVWETQSKAHYERLKEVVEDLNSKRHKQFEITNKTHIELRKNLQKRLYQIAAS